MPKLSFPDGFFWGSATSAYQVEGGNHNDWSVWEKENAERLAGEAKGRFGHLPHWAKIEKEASTPSNYLSGKAIDHFNRFEEDFELAQKFSHNAHRLSLEWSRIEPEEGKFDHQALDHYRKVLKTLEERKLEPFVTLWHWTLPVWLAEKGGVESKDFPFYFERYTDFVVPHLKDSVRFWMTLNEPTSVIGNSYIRGLWPPQKKNWFSALVVYWRLAQAHRRGYHAIHKIDKGAQVGFSNLMHSFEPYTRRSPFDALGIAVAKFFSNRLMLYLTPKTHDYLAVQYYFHDRIRFIKKIPRGDMPKNDLGWDIYPKGLYNVLDYLKHYHLPIYITENGLADADDSKRKQFLIDHLSWVHQAIEEGVDVRGYFHWSLLDNFEWDKGYWPKFGLVEVDRKTMERRPRSSAQFFAEIAKSNSLPETRE